MNDQSFTMTEATADDSSRIWKIRYHPVVNAAALNQELVDFTKHDQWFQRQYGMSSEHRCYVLKVEKRVIGYCRFDRNEEGAYIVSIAIDPAYHGHGAGTFLLSSAIDRFGLEKTLFATIKKENDVSQRLFEKAGFEVIKKEGDNVTMQKEL